MGLYKRPRDSPRLCSLSLVLYLFPSFSFAHWTSISLPCSLLPSLLQTVKKIKSQNPNPQTPTPTNTFHQSAPRSQDPHLRPLSLPPSLAPPPLPPLTLTDRRKFCQSRTLKPQTLTPNKSLIVRHPFLPRSLARSLARSHRL